MSSSIGRGKQKKKKKSKPVRWLVGDQIPVPSQWDDRVVDECGESTATFRSMMRGEQVEYPP